MAFEWRRSSRDDEVAEVTRRRLQLLIADLEAARTGESADRPEPSAALTAAPAEVAVPGEVAGPAGPAGTPAEDPDLAPAGRHAARGTPLGARAAAWAGDRAPVLVADGRFGVAQLGVVALVVAAGLLVTAWLVLRSGGDRVALAPPRPAVSAPALTGAASETAAIGGTGSSGIPSTDPATGEIVVDVVGQVRRPGITVLPAGARVVDAVEAAGGLRAGFRAAAVNMARLLVDGEQVLIRRTAGPAVPGPAGASASSAAGGLVNLNTADQVALETLPGVGPVTAAAILAWRTEHGAFSAVEELLEVSGIGEATLAEIAPHVTL